MKIGSLDREDLEYEANILHNKYLWISIGSDPDHRR